MQQYPLPMDAPPPDHARALAEQNAARNRNERILAAAMALVILIAGITARSGTLPAFWAKYTGVALWCALVYWLVVFVRPRMPVLKACIAAAAIGWAVEFFQLTPGPRGLASLFPPSRWVLGTTFRAPDLPAYLVGAVCAAALHAAGRWFLRSRTQAWARNAPFPHDRDE